MKVDGENQEDGGKLRSEERKGRTGPHNFNKLQKQKQTPTRTKKNPRAAPQY